MVFGGATLHSKGFIQAWEVNGIIETIESLLKAKIKGEDGDELIIDKVQVDVIIRSTSIAHVEFKDVGGLPTPTSMST